MTREDTYNCLFKSYLPIDAEKRPICTFKDAILYDKAKELTGYSGILKDNIVLVDIDDMEQAETMLDIVKDKKLGCIVFETTRGKHFYFLNNDKINKCHTKVKLAIGINADFKVGNNTLGVLKLNGVERNIVYQSELTEIPCFFIPVKTNVELWKMSEGERDNTLFSYKNCLDVASIPREEHKAIYEVINNYIFAEPLHENDIDRLLREDTYIENYKEKSSYKLNDIAKCLLVNENIIRLNGEQLCIYKNGYYQTNTSEIERTILKYIPNITSRPRNEIIKYLKLYAPSKILDAQYICFKNGVYDIENDVFLKQHSPDYIIINQIPHNYNEDAHSNLVNKTLKEWANNDDDLVILLEQIMGYCMMSKVPYRKFFILTGANRNGKSTFLKVLKNMLGDDNVSNVSLKGLETRFINSKLQNKLTNLGDDIEDNFIRETATIKKFTSGEPITIERKGQDPETLTNYATLLFSANSIPKFTDKTGAILDRLIIVPFNNYFDKNSNNVNLVNELNVEEHMETLIQRALNGLNDLINDNRFIEPEIVKNTIIDYSLNNNPLLEFIKSNPEEHYINKTPQEIIVEFNNFRRNFDIEYSEPTPKKMTQAITGYYTKLQCKSCNSKRTYQYR